MPSRHRRSEHGRREIPYNPVRTAALERLPPARPLRLTHLDPSTEIRPRSGTKPTRCMPRPSAPLPPDPGKTAHLPRPRGRELCSSAVVADGGIRRIIYGRRGMVVSATGPNRAAGGWARRSGFVAPRAASGLHFRPDRGKSSSVAERPMAKPKVTFSETPNPRRGSSPSAARLVEGRRGRTSTPPGRGGRPGRGAAAAEPGVRSLFIVADFVTCQGARRRLGRAGPAGPRRAPKCDTCPLCTASASASHSALSPASALQHSHSALPPTWPPSPQNSQRRPRTPRWMPPWTTPSAAGASASWRRSAAGWRCSAPRPSCSSRATRRSASARTAISST